MDIQENLISWLKSLKGWQTELAYRLLEKQALASLDILEIIQMLKNGDPFIAKEFPNIITNVNRVSIVLKSISCIENIEQLSPRNPLEFAETGLTVIYGNNGTGKSGYTRILKKITGKPKVRDLIGNIYKESQDTGSCKLTYLINGTEQNSTWQINTDPITQLASIDIFDTDTGISYLRDTNAISYVPPIIAFFTQLSNNYDKIKQILQGEKDALKSELPVPPAEYNSSIFIKNYKVSKLVLDKFQWLDADEQNLISLERLLRDKDPLQTAQEIRNKKSKLDKIVEDLSLSIQKVSKENYDEILKLSEEAFAKKKIVTDAGKVLGESVKLEGVGTSTWKALWSAAKEFSIKEAYKQTSDLLSENERCVLCHQVLSSEAKNRLKIFEEFISNTIAKEAEKAETIYNDKLKQLPLSIIREDIDNSCIAAGVDETIRDKIYVIWDVILKNGRAIREKSNLVEINQDIISNLKEISERYKEEILKLEQHANELDRNKTKAEVLELKTRKWCTEQYDFIVNESKRQEQIKKYDIWLGQTNTRSVTTKVNEIADSVITQEYVQRFNDELQKLGAYDIKMEIVKHADKSIIRHSLRIAEVTKGNPMEILSEGEMRIIALAAFIADVTGGNVNNPFIFDDPISSLDQLFEERTVKRLVELSTTRQVIVFTHRLSLLGQLYEECKKQDLPLKSIGIKKEHWGTGEIGDIPFFARNPEKTLRKIKNENLVQARKIYEQEGYDVYYPQGKMLCSEIRILIERIVETTFLADVVQRYRRAVNTMGKIGKLAKISIEDCNMVDKFMTKYSYFEHSQPSESPVSVPEPDKIGKDIDDLLSWFDEFIKRT